MMLMIPGPRDGCDYGPTPEAVSANERERELLLERAAACAWAPGAPQGPV